MAVPKTPSGLGKAGTVLWKQMHADYSFNAAESVTVEEMCRIKDRLDDLNEAVSDDGVVRLVPVDYESPEDGLRVVITGALTEARQQANVYKQLVASLRLPDESGVKPQQRGPRGSYQPKGSGAGSSKVSSLDRARAAKSG